MYMGSYFPSKSFYHAMQRIWSPDTYDANGNPDDVIMELKGEQMATEADD